MVKPRALGNTAKVVMESIEDALAENNDEFFHVAALIQRGDVQEAMETLKVMSRKNNLALRALTFLRADRLADAQDVVMSVKLRRKD